MAHIRRTSVIREMRLPEVARLYKAGQPIARIAETLGVHSSQITRDLQFLSKRWQESADLDYHDWAVRELATLIVAEQEYWQAWLASKADDETSMSKQKGETAEGREVWVRKRRQVGNPMFLDGVMKCVRERCKLLGLYAGSNLPRWRSVEPGGGDGGDDNPADVERELARLNADLDDWARSCMHPRPDQLPPGFEASH